MKPKYLLVAFLIVSLLFINKITFYLIGRDLLNSDIIWIAVLIFAFNAFSISINKKLPSIIYLYFFFIIYLFYLSYANKNNFDAIKRDFFNQLLFLSGIIIGNKLKEWDIIYKSYFWVLAIGILLNIISLPLSTGYLRTEITETGEKPLAYELQYILVPAIALFFIRDDFSKKYRYFFIIVIVAFTLYFIEQLLFTKRVMLIKFVIIISVNFLILSVYKSWRRNIRLFIIFVFVGFLFIQLFGFNLQLYFDALIDRFYTSGSVTETIEEDGRTVAFKIVIENLTENKTIYTGNGFGGAIYDSRLWYDLEGYTTSIEIGQTNPLIKGGILFWLFYNFLFLYILFKYNRFSKNYFTLGLWAIVLVYYIFTFFEGVFITDLRLYEILVGLSMGYLLNKNNSRYSILSSSPYRKNNYYENT